MEKASNLEQLIERQAKLWEVGRRLAREGGEAARREMVHLGEGPWITISRQIGAGGGAVAQRLAEQLGWQIFDREILAQIARHTHTKEKIISRLDEHAVGRFNDYVNQLIVPDDIGQAGFLVELTRVCWALARQGKAILIGRGANWFLDPRYGLRIRLIAPFDVRVARIARQQGLPEHAATKLVRDHDAEQQGFIRQAFGRHIDDPLGYDLVLNTEHLDDGVAAETAASALCFKLRSQS
jgi:cytidylate kinase